MKKILIYCEDSRFRQRCESELRSEGYIPYSVSSENDVFDFMKHGQGVDLVIVNARPESEGCHHVLEFLRQITPHPSILLTADYFCFWNDFTSWLADECLVVTPDLGEFKEKVKSFLCGPSQPGKLADRGSFSVDWA